MKSCSLFEINFTFSELDDKKKKKNTKNWQARRRAKESVNTRKSIGSCGFPLSSKISAWVWREVQLRSHSSWSWRARSATRETRGLRAHAMCFMIERERAGDGLTMREREGECQVDIVDGDNAAEIAGEQRGLMMTLLVSERTSELSARVGLDTSLALSSSPRAQARLFSPAFDSGSVFPRVLRPAEARGGPRRNQVTKTDDKCSRAPVHFYRDALFTTISLCERMSRAHAFRCACDLTCNF